MRRLALNPHDTPLASGRRSGFVVLENIVAIVVLGIALAGLISLMLSIARRNNDAANIGLRNAQLAATARWLSVLPYSKLATGSTCHATTAGRFPNTTCWTIDSLSPKLRQVRVVVTPQVAPALRPDTVVLLRVIDVPINPLNKP